MLKKCYWKGRRIDCAAIFTTFPTDRGMCCTFNMHKASSSIACITNSVKNRPWQAEEIFKDTVYSRLVTEMQDLDKDLAFGNPNPPSWYANNSEPVSHQGVGKGLTVILDAHSDLIAASSVAEDFQVVVEGADSTSTNTKEGCILTLGFPWHGEQPRELPLVFPAQHQDQARPRQPGRPHRGGR